MIKLKADGVITEHEAQKIQCEISGVERDAKLLDTISKKDAKCIFCFVELLKDTDGICCGLNDLYDAYYEQLEKLFHTKEIGKVMAAITDIYNYLALPIAWDDRSYCTCEMF